MEKLAPNLDFITHPHTRVEVEKIAADARAPDPIEMTWQGVADLIAEHPMTARPLLALLCPYLPSLGHEAMWQLWRAALYADVQEWMDELWQAAGSGRQEQVQSVIEIIGGMEEDPLCPAVYSHIHGRLTLIGQEQALELSRRLAYGAVSMAFRRPWVGAGKLFETILEKEDPVEFEFEVKGAWGNWFLALGIVFDEIIDTPYPVSTGVVMEWKMEQQMEMLLDSGLGAENDIGVRCGKALARGLTLREEAFAPLLRSWIEAGGDWMRLRENSGPQARRWIDQTPWVRRARLVSMANKAGRAVEEEEEPRRM